MNQHKNKYSDVKNVINGLIIMAYLTGFLLLAPGILELLLKNSQNVTDSNVYFLYYIFAVITFLAALTVVIKKVIVKEAIKINFWTFIPVIYFGIVCFYLSM